MELTKTFETAHAPDTVWRGLSDVRLVASCLPGASIVEEISPDQYKGKLAIKVGPLAASFDGLIAIERKPEEKIAIVTGKGADVKSSSRVTAKMTYQVRPSQATPGASQVDIHSDINLAGALAQFGKAAVMQEIANRMTNAFVQQFEAQLAHDEASFAADAADAAAMVETSGAAESSHASGVHDAAGVGATNGGATKAGATSMGTAAGMEQPQRQQPAPPPRPRPLPTTPNQLDAGNLLWSILKDKITGFFRKLLGR
ncbi:MAG: (2Fe-2S)-binding domain protein [Herminiimonas sp.]|nr:(2Fe-2S)-binding domain protein [Herminiimonas sp.]